MARDALLSNQDTEKLNFDTNYMTSDEVSDLFIFCLNWIPQASFAVKSLYVPTPDFQALNRSTAIL